MAIMEGSSPKEKLESTYWTALQKNWMLWPAVQAVNFKLVPLEHRVLVVNVVSLGKWAFCCLFPVVCMAGVGMGDDVGTLADMFSVLVGWNCYLSYVNSQGGAKVEKEEAKLEGKVEKEVKKNL